MKRLWLVLLLLLLVPSLPGMADAVMTCPPGATCKYVRPSNDGNGTDFNYGTEDGSSEANAFDGWADVTGLAPGDTLCFPGGDEPFFEPFDTTVNGTSDSARVIYEGCGPTQAVIWSAQGLSGDRSFDASQVAINGVDYEWVSMGDDIYRKRMDRLARTLWEDDTWLNPVNIYAESEATILATLEVGKFGNRDFGDGTYRIYYRATTSAKNPTNTVIRTHYVPSTTALFNGFFRIDKAYITVRNIEVRGESVLVESYGIMIQNATHTLLDNVLVYKCNNGIDVDPSSVVNNGMRWTNTSVMWSTGEGTRISGDIGLNDFIIDGGHYDHNGVINPGLATLDGGEGYYNGIGFTYSDGDGISFGWNGGLVTDVIIKNVTANYNVSSGVFSGTNAVDHFITNFQLLSSVAVGNGRRCFTEGNDAELRGLVVIAGLVCGGATNHPFNTTYLPSMHFSSSYPSNATVQPDPHIARTVIVTNVTFMGNESVTRLDFQPSADSNFTFRNLVFDANPSTAVASTERGDIWSRGMALIGDEVFDNIHFNSLPGQARPFATLGVANTQYMYNVAGDLAAFNTATGATNTSKNVDPLLVSITDAHLQSGSPLRDTGTDSIYCLYADATTCDGTPDVGAYQYNSASAPAAPTGLHFVGATSDTLVQLVWVPSLEADLAGYKIYMGTSAGNTVLVKTVTLAQAAAAHHPPTQWFGTVTAAGTYYFTVAAYNTTGGTFVSAKSNEVSRVLGGMTARAAKQ